MPLGRCWGQRLSPLRPAAKLSPQTKRQRPRKKCAVTRPPSAPPRAALSPSSPPAPFHGRGGGGSEPNGGAGSHGRAPRVGARGAQLLPPPPQSPPGLLPGEVAAHGKSATCPSCSGGGVSADDQAKRTCRGLESVAGNGGERAFLTARGAAGGLYPGHKALGWDGEGALHRGFLKLCIGYLCVGLSFVCRI